MGSHNWCASPEQCNYLRDALRTNTKKSMLKELNIDVHNMDIIIQALCLQVLFSCTFDFIFPLFLYIFLFFILNITGSSFMFKILIKLFEKIKKKSTRLNILILGSYLCLWSVTMAMLGFSHDCRYFSRNPLFSHTMEWELPVFAALK